MPRFGELEEQVMGRLWAAREPLAVREVRDALLPERDLAYTTVMTVLDNLHRKGAVRRHLDGRAYRYEPVLSRDAHTASLMREDWLSGGGRAAAMVHFVEGMSTEQLGALRDALRVALPEGREAEGREAEGTGTKAEGTGAEGMEAEGTEAEGSRSTGPAG